MRKKIDLKSLFFGALLGAVTLFSIAAAKNTETSAWDYTTYFYRGSHPPVEGIQKLGDGGWELVSAIATDGGRTSGFIFKRPKTKAVD